MAGAMVLVALRTQRGQRPDSSRARMRQRLKIGFSYQDRRAEGIACVARALK